MATEYQLRAAALVEKARQSNGLSQHAFGLAIGKTQGVVSKYELAKISVPGEVVVQCMAMLGLLEKEPPTADALAELVRRALGGPSDASLRGALANLMASFEQSKNRA